MVFGEQKWPDCLWIVRHGESSGNVARRLAYESDLALIDVPERDVDVPLSALGERQARALGHWFGRMPADQRPTAVRTSPYVRAVRTAELICEEAGLDPEEMNFICDERLREKEFGILDRYTRRGISERYPEQAELRLRLGKFYHRPPGGESWADVILRLRSAMNTINLHYCDRRVLIVCHQVVVLCMRYVLEGLDEATILRIDKEGEILNCGICTYEFEPDESGLCAPSLVMWNQGAPLEAEGAPKTAEPDMMTGTR